MNLHIIRRYSNIISWEREKILYKFKVALVGDSNSIITKIIKSHMEGYFNEKYESTIGVEFLRKELTVNDNPVTLQIWKITSSDIFSSIGSIGGNAYLKGSNGVIISFDSIGTETLKKMQELLEVVKDLGDIPIIIAFTKKDSKKWKMDKNNEAKIIADQLHCEYFELSSDKGENIDELFTLLSKPMLEKEIQKEIGKAH
jgi:GTPase SAR1 family protein